jgi:quercetin 2,3-dioxygenase
MDMRILPGKIIMEGAGVRLKRIFGYYQRFDVDPFLLLDHFNSEKSEEYTKGFPWHPHRGIETVTYIQKGSVVHQDSLGNEDVITPGDVQWMTAGRGVIHSEMPLEQSGGVDGFQLWLNLPAAEKKCDPRYRALKKEDIPVVTGPGYSLKLISGHYDGTTGAVTELSMPVLFCDVALEKGHSMTFSPPRGSTAVIYCYNGSLTIEGETIKEQCLLLQNCEKSLEVLGEEKASFLYLEGAPLREPIAWHGSIVMNNDMELEAAMSEYTRGTFLEPS